jgi:IS66 C-terminal element/Transposase IS66 family
LKCFRPFVASWPAPSASGRSESGRVGITPTGLVHLLQGTHNNIAERSVRGAGVGRKNYLFFGSDTGGDRAAIIYSLIETCKLNHIDPQRYLHYVLERIADHPINRIEELLPWNLIDQLQQPAQVTHALAA